MSHDTQDHEGRPLVAITGLGVKSPAGNTPDELWARLRSGRSAAAPITRFDAGALPVQFACEVHDFEPTDYFSTKEARRVDRFTQLGFAAAADALRDAGEPAVDPARAATVVGTGVGGIETLVDQLGTFSERGPSRVSPFLVPMMMANANAGVIALELGWTGPSICVATACAAGTHAIGEGARLIRDDTAAIVLAGGSEAAVLPITIAAFHRMGALSTRRDDPARASRPFDAERDGFVMGEGAGFVVLEPLERARARGAPVYGVVAGYGRTSDAHHITAPPPGGEGAVACMQAALDDAGLDAGDIGHVNAHGTSTPLNDASEAGAIRKVFASPPPVTSVKGVTGHLIGAAGAVEAVTAALSLQHHEVPPTANVERVDDDIELDVVFGEPRPIAVAPVISNSFGFGGHNASLVIAPSL